VSSAERSFGGRGWDRASLGIACGARAGAAPLGLCAFVRTDSDGGHGYAVGVVAETIEAVFPVRRLRGTYSAWSLAGETLLFVSHEGHGHEGAVARRARSALSGGPGLRRRGDCLRRGKRLGALVPFVSFVRTQSGGGRGEAVGVPAEDLEAVFASGELPSYSPCLVRTPGRSCFCFTQRSRRARRR
jgi:hypothetical protein